MDGIVPVTQLGKLCQIIRRDVFVWKSERDCIDGGVMCSINQMPKHQRSAFGKVDDREFLRVRGWYVADIFAPPR